MDKVVPLNEYLADCKHEPILLAFFINTEYRYKISVVKKSIYDDINNRFITIIYYLYNGIYYTYLNQILDELVTIDNSLYIKYRFFHMGYKQALKSS